jgi:hypothetical protein
MSAARKRMVDVGLIGPAVNWDLLIERSKREQTESNADLESSRLFIPGIVLQMVYPKDVRRLDARLLFLREDTKVDILRVPRTEFVRVRRERGMFLNQYVCMLPQSAMPIICATHHVVFDCSLCVGYATGIFVVGFVLNDY